MSSAEPIRALVGELYYVDEFSEKNAKQRVEPKKRLKYWHIGIHWGEGALREYLGFKWNGKGWKAWKKRYKTGYRVESTEHAKPTPIKPKEYKEPVKRKPFYVLLTNIETGGQRRFQYTRLAEEFLKGKRSSVDNHVKSGHPLNGYKVEKIYTS